MELVNGNPPDKGQTIFVWWIGSGVAEVCCSNRGYTKRRKVHRRFEAATGEATNFNSSRKATILNERAAVSTTGRCRRDGVTIDSRISPGTLLRVKELHGQQAWKVSEKTMRNAAKESAYRSRLLTNSEPYPELWGDIAETLLQHLLIAEKLARAT